MRTVAIPTSVVMLAASKKDNELFETLKITEEDYNEWGPKAERAAKRILGQNVYSFLEHYQNTNKKVPAIKEYLEYKVINRRPKSLPKEVVKALDSLANAKNASSVKEPSLSAEMAKLDKIISKAGESYTEIFEYVRDNIGKWNKLFGKNPSIRCTYSGHMGNPKAAENLTIKYEGIDVEDAKKKIKNKFNVSLKNTQSGLYTGNVRVKGVPGYFRFTLSEKKGTLVIEPVIVL